MASKKSGWRSKTMKGFSTNFGGRKHKWRSKGGMSAGGVSYRSGKS